MNPKADRFRALHVKGDPLILFNAWDAGSAKAVAEAGAKAIATGSWSVAAAQGFADGEAMPLDLALANIARMAEAVDLPVTIDFERGYAEEPGQIADNVRAAAEAGAIGCNFEDGLAGGEIRPAGDQAARIAAIRDATDAGFFITARTDLFLHSAPETHESLIDEALARGEAYAEAGASGLFVPGLADEGLIERICSASALPVNIMIWPGRTPPLRRLAELGVARISHAGGPWRIAMAALKEAARRAHDLEG
ncbi:MAG TPA: isocitrate lyase/phosphoenolpyruvate mutase family protein [Allosphingosinicella sp.]|nr:isocitrate lyase/phosphoenolpyruvate mutase family protein [Allosphingosinicella sp.]